MMMLLLFMEEVCACFLFPLFVSYLFMLFYNLRSLGLQIDPNFPGLQAACSNAVQEGVKHRYMEEGSFMFVVCLFVCLCFWFLSVFLLFFFFLLLLILFFSLSFGIRSEKDGRRKKKKRRANATTIRNTARTKEMSFEILCKKKDIFFFGFIKLRYVVFEFIIIHINRINKRKIHFCSFLFFFFVSCVFFFSF
jgi:hypothetical protein